LNKLEISIGSCNINKLHKELIDANIYSVGEYIVGGVSPTIVTFVDIVKVDHNDLEGNYSHTTYQKRRVEMEPIEEGSDETHKVEYWDDYTTETIALIAQVEDCVACHDSTPLPVPLTEIELLKEQIKEDKKNNALNTYDIFKLRGLI